MPTSLFFSQTTAGKHCLDLLKDLTVTPNEDHIKEFTQEVVCALLRKENLPLVLQLIQVPVIKSFLLDLAANSKVLGVLTCKIDCGERRHVCEVAAAICDEQPERLPAALKLNKDIMAVLDVQQSCYDSRKRLAKQLQLQKFLAPGIIDIIFKFASDANDPITEKNLTKAAFSIG